MSDLVQRLRRYSLRSGYAWYCHRAADRIEQLEEALAKCRTAMPIPDGDALEQLWSEAVSDADAVPAYAKASIADLETKILEQCRINGIGAERELALMANVERLERENAELVKDAMRYRYLFTGDKVYAKFREVYDFWDGCDEKAGFDDAIDAVMRGDL